MPTVESSIASPSGVRGIQFVPTGGDLSGFGELMGFHRHLLGDRIRTEAFLNAIAKVVKPGDVVIDLGTGTGILAMAACRAGASKVYAIEYGGIVKLAKELARQNGFEDRIEFFAGDSRNFRAPRRADLIISECLGFMGLGGTMIAALSDLVRRCLRTNGTVIPGAIEAYLVPVESDLHFDYVYCWTHDYGFDFSPAQKLAANNLYVATFSEADFVAEPQRAAAVDIMRDLPNGESNVRLGFRTHRRCRFHGYCGWFNARVCDGVALSNSPSEPSVIWQQVFLPLEREIHLDAGAIINVDFDISHTARLPVVFRWHTRAVDYNGTAFEMGQSTEQSFPNQN